MEAEQIRTHALTTTPETLEWDCFTFGIVQRSDYFAFYAMSTISTSTASPLD